MKVYRFRKPYKPNGRTTFPDSKGKSGVYLIKENDKLVYIGFSGKNLYKTLYRHFEAWNHRGQVVVTYNDRLNKNNYTIRIVYCTPLQAEKLERALILKHKPRDNENKYTNYQLNFQDIKVVETYKNSEVLPDPF